MSRRPKVGIDLAPIAFRSRAPGTAAHVEHQARALLAMKLDWDWVVVATPRVLVDTPFFSAFNPIICRDAPLSYHASITLGSVWARAGCALGLATAFFTPLFGPPVVTNYFDANFHHSVRDFRSLRGRLKQAALRSLWWRSRRRSRALFILSDYGRSRMVEVDPKSKDKWIVAPCGCPPVPAGTIRPGWAAHLAGRPFILYAGAFSENKNQRRLIQAWDELRRRRKNCPMLVLIGPSPPEYIRETIRPTLTLTSHSDEVVIPGFVAAEELAWAFRNAYAYVQPSFAEGFGIPVVEAMSCGVPVACSDSTSLPEIAGNAAILFNPSDVADMSRALEQIVFDEPTRQELRRRGFERARMFTWHRHAEIVASRIASELRRMNR